MKQVHFLIATMLVATGATSIFAQNSQIQGTIVDQAGAAITDARITVTDSQKGVVVKETKSSGDGTFTVPALGQGNFSMSVESSGMKRLERPNISLDANQVLNLGSLQMSIGATTEQVTVEATSPLVESATAQKDFTITSKQVLETSLDGRDFQSLIRTAPGVVSNDTSDFRLAFNNTDSFHVNGLRGSQNNVFLDGSINTDVGANDGQYTQLSLDAVGEFKVQTSVFNAEYGRIAGVLIAANTKSGTQGFHGTLYEFNRNDAYDSNSFFNNLQGLPKSKLRFNQFGGNLGGPLYIPKVSTPHNKKLFFFFNYEGTRASRPNGNSYYDAPNPALLTGDFRSSLRYNSNGTPLLITNPDTNLPTAFQVGTVFEPGTAIRSKGGTIIGGTPYPNNMIPTAQFSTQAAAFQKLLGGAYRGLSNFAQTPGTPDSVRIPFQDTYTFNKDQKALRTDYAISSRVNMFFRWVDDAQREGQGFGIFSGNSYPVLPEYREKPGASYALNVVATLSPTTTNELILTYNHLTQRVDIDNSVNPSTYSFQSLGFTFGQLFPNSNERNTFPRFSAGGYNVFPFPPGWRSEAKTYALTDNVTKIVGSHTLKAGVFVDINTAGQQPYWTYAPQFDFNPNQQLLADTGNGVANLLLGNYLSVSQTNGVFFGAFRFNQVETFAQDSWKVNNRLTLEYGLRWAYLGPTYSHGKYLENYFDPSRYNPAQAVSINIAPGLQQGSIIPGSGNPYNGIVQEGTKGYDLGFAKHRFNNLGPRFGFAYDPTGDGKTAIRGGGGIFYERIRQNVNSFDGLGNPPLAYTPNLYNGNIDNLSPALVSGGTLFPVGINTFNREGKIPTIYSWSFDIQHQLSKTMALDIGYVGNQANHLSYASDLNQLPLGTTTSGTAFASVNSQGNALRPYRGFANIQYTDFAANSNYHALQVQLTRRFNDNLTVSANYTWSRAMDQADDDTTAIPYTYDRRREYGPAGFDRTNTFTANYVYQLPRLNHTNAFIKQTIGGWEVTGITRFWSGFPLTITSPSTNTGTLDGGARVDYTAGTQLKPSHQTWQEFLNPYAFTRPLDGTLGNTGRGILRGPGINQWDISLFKNFHFTENIQFQLRLETFNTFNHTQFAGINTSISPSAPGQAVTSATVSTSGQVNSTRDPRTVQLGAKFYF